MVIIVDYSIHYYDYQRDVYLQYKPQVHQQGQGMHFQLGMPCSFQIFPPKSTCQQDKVLEDYWKLKIKWH